MTIAPFNYVQVWHQRFNEDPAHRWLRDLVRQVSAPSTA
ncbi:MAG: LysR family transcriptional regulator, partial [Pseudomonas bubulae]